MHMTLNLNISPRYDLQYGFRERRSYETRLASLTEDLAHKTSQGKQTDVILSDFSKAFDKVDHTKLLLKLRHSHEIRNHTKEQTRKIEKVQRHAARQTLNDYTRTTSVTSLLPQFSWQILEERRSVACLCLFYKIINGFVEPCALSRLHTAHT